jgi:ribose transport system ATP-binding protein
VDELILEMKDISKAFGGIHALRDVTFSCRKGEVHALVGENGAGKSTLMKILAGALQPDHGEIFIRGDQTRINVPADARRLGISIIYQEFNLVAQLSVVENVFLGREYGSMGIIDSSRMKREAAALFDRLGVRMNTSAKIEDISVAQAQMVEIAKALLYKADIIVMDEPSAVLAGEELDRLFEIIKNLQAEGVTIIYISHRLDEVFQIADRATVLKDGVVAGSVDIANTTKPELIRMMVGRDLGEAFPEVERNIGEPVLEACNVCASNLVKNACFTLHSGEILGVAGMVGSGRTELVRAIFGADPLDDGHVMIKGTKVGIRTPKKARQLGLALVPEDRKNHGLVLGLSIKDNITLPVLDRLSRFGVMDLRKEKAVVEQSFRELQIKASHGGQQVSALSGGNQQKVVLAKWLATQPEIIILDEPTRGIDVGAKAEVYGLIRELARQGKAVLVISSELTEILGLSDRILVMHEGRIAGELSRAEATEERLLALATGQQVDGGSPAACEAPERPAKNA